MTMGEKGPETRGRGGVVRRWAMVALMILIVAVPVLPARAGEEVVIDGVAHIRNPATPAEGVETWRLEEQWRIGGDEEDVLLGIVSFARTDEAGNVYLLDSQLNQVLVFSPEGEYVRTFGREGEGPGEFNRPIALAMLPGERIGVLQGMPGKVVLFDSAGNPAGQIVPGGGSANEGFRMVQEFDCQGDQLAVLGLQFRRTDEGMSRLRYLARIDLEGKELTRVLEEEGSDDLISGKFVERDEYYVDRGRWALDRQGRMYAARDMKRYAIHVFGPDGSLERVIERDYEPRNRNEEEKDQVGAGLMVVVNGQRVRMEVEAEDQAPCIDGLRMAESGDLWVLNGHGQHELPDGILARYDVFDPQGHFIREVVIAGDGDAEKDRLQFLGSDRLVRIQGFRDALRSTDTPGEEDEESAEDLDAADEFLEVICYRVVRES